MTTIYHNPRCSKSRATLELLSENGIDPEIVLYLESPPDTETLKSITEKLGCSMDKIIRKGEALYKELGLSQSNFDEQYLRNTVSQNPILLERPIVVNGNKAAIGRPPENVLDIL
jgi:arsenate reductase